MQSKFNDRNVVEQVINYYNSGLTFSEIAHKFSVTWQTIRVVLIRNEIELRYLRARCKLSNTIIYHLYISGVAIDDIALKAGVKVRAISNRLKKMGVVIPKESSRKYQLNEDFFNSWSYDMAYILGFIFADGNMSKDRRSFSISQHEKYILIIIADCLGIPEERIKKVQDNYHLSVSSIRMCQMLYWYGITPRKSLTVECPPRVPTKYAGAFLRGVIDGDGWVDKKIARVVIYTGSEKFAEGLNNILQNLNINSRIRNDSRGYYEVRISKRENVQKLGALIYNQKGDLYLKRKYERFKLE